jgi:hypothetical protein
MAETATNGGEKTGPWFSKISLNKVVQSLLTIKAIPSFLFLFCSI